MIVLLLGDLFIGNPTLKGVCLGTIIWPRYYYLTLTHSAQRRSPLVCVFVPTAWRISIGLMFSAFPRQFDCSKSNDSAAHRSDIYCTNHQVEGEGCYKDNKINRYYSCTRLCNRLYPIKINSSQFELCNNRCQGTYQNSKTLCCCIESKKCLR